MLNVVMTMRFMAQPPESGLPKGFGAESLTSRLNTRSGMTLLSNIIRVDRQSVHGCTTPDALTGTFRVYFMPRASAPAV
jgi:hypothetical protein